jgi:hypothetical protein
MLVNYPEAAHWQVDTTRLDLVEEFRRKPRGPHGDDLQKLLHRMRWTGDFETAAATCSSSRRQAASGCSHVCRVSAARRSR